MPVNNITLIGMPGAGKSTVGVVLAKILNYHFVDVDLCIQKQQGQTLHNLIEKEGAEGFIALENQALLDIDEERTVISTGGSAVYSGEGMEYLSSVSTVVYLKITYDELLHRLGDLDERGVVFRDDNPEDLLDLYEERTPLYEKYAHITVDIDGLSITEAARKVAQVVSG